MQRFLKNLIWACLLVIPFLVLYVANGKSTDLLSASSAGMYFPFISGKNFAFRILVEIALAAWVLLAIIDSKYRLVIKKSPLLIAYAVFMVVLFIADTLAVDSVKSFWSNFERMEGFVGHIHLFAYFVVLSAMLTTVKEWNTMFKTFVVSNVFVLLYAIGQFCGIKGYIIADTFPNFGAKLAALFPINQSANRLDANIGNAAYFGVFALIFVFILALLWVQSKNPKKSWYYPVLMILNAVALLYTGTRGSMIGLLIGGLATMILVAYYKKGKIRTVLTVLIATVTVAVALIFTFKDSAFVQSNPAIARFASVSPGDVTGASRLAMWKISYEAWLEKPVFGYGQDNFSYVFARKYIPEKMYGLEPWYDRSHDVFFDWLIAAGLLGLVSYLALYVIALYLTWNKKSHIPVYEKAILTGLVIGYFIHNIFVFDNLTSYILFVLILAYIAVRSREPATSNHNRSNIPTDQVVTVWLPLVLIILALTQYYVNYKPLRVNALMIRAMDVNSLVQTKSFPEVIKIQKDSFKEAIEMNTLGSIEAQEQLYQMVLRMSQVTIPPETPAQDKQAIAANLQEFVAYAKEVASKTPKKDEIDVRMLSIEGIFYNSIGESAQAEEVLSLARSVAPNKQLISFDLVRAYLIQGKFKEGYDLAKETYLLAPAYADAQKWYVLSAAYNGTYKEARADVTSRGGIVEFNNDVLTALVTTKQTTLAIELLQQLKKEKPELTAQVDDYIKQVIAISKR